MIIVLKCIWVLNISEAIAITFEKIGYKKKWKEMEKNGYA